MTENLIIFPASFSQQRLWFLDQMNPGSTIYNLPMLLHFREGLAAPTLIRALSEVLRRHEVLRTTFSLVGEQLAQVVSPASPMNLPIIDLSDLSRASGEAQAQSLIQEEGRRPFDLGRGPLLRATLIKLGEEGYLMLLTTHHIVSDGWSLAVLRSEIHRLYAAYGSGQPSPLPELAIQYADFTVWQREYLQGEVLEKELDYWRKQLAGVSVLDLPTDRPRPAFQTDQGASVLFHCAPSLTGRLYELSQKQGVTPYMCLLALFQLLLSRYSGQTDVAVGTAVAGRNRAETEPLIGLFVNTLVMRTNMTGEPTFAELLRRVKEVCLGAYAHQDVPFEKLVEELQPERDLSRSPLFQVMFVLQNLPQKSHNIAGGEASRFATAPQSARYDLVLSVTQERQSLTGSFLYSTALYDHSRVGRMAAHFQRLLQALTEDPQQPIWRISLLSAAEREQLLLKWNDTAREYPQNTCIHWMIEAQAARTPEAVAVASEGRQLNYRDLNEGANQLAHYLQSLGVRPEVLVGLCVDRSVEMVMGLLGILKAGGAYLPLDPQYPPQRLAFMLEDAGVNLTLTQDHLREYLPQHRGRTISLDGDWSEISQHNPQNPVSQVVAENLAYVIYTSGSTGVPKGVAAQHRNIVNFFIAMDPLLLPQAGPGVWLAVTSVCFDISVLELLWTLARGFKVVVQPEGYKAEAQTELASNGARQKPVGAHEAPAESRSESLRERPHLTSKSISLSERRPNQVGPQAREEAPGFSLFYFAHDGASADRQNRYRLLLEGARFADRHGFTAVWTPERHFHSFGDLYPNPAVAASALATITEKIQIRAGSVVLPLHHAVRVAEEWAMVDNLSGGRIGVSFASGWHAADFIFAPEHYRRRKQVMMEQLEQVRRLWRGESLTYRGGAGEDVAVKIYPPPVQSELPVWLTAAGNPETFEMAGRHGCGVLTHLLGQSVEELQEKIRIYREAWAAAGHKGQGHVSLMAHTYVGQDEELVREQVRAPFKKYLEGSVDLMRKLGESLGVKIEGESIRGEDLEAVLEHAFERYYEESGLMGGIEKCVRMVEKISAVGVDEIACLIDFGVEEEAALKGLERLVEVKERSRAEWELKWRYENAERSGGNIRETAEEGVSGKIARHRVTHMQCTPSQARLLSADQDSLRAMGQMRELLLGGEVLPLSLVDQLRPIMSGKLHNMYGPTETTVWSATYTVNFDEAIAPIGGPLSNTQIYILSKELEPEPIGVVGELYIGGAGVTRGYLHNPNLTAERFVPDHLTGSSGARLYRTGDFGRYLTDGRIEFLGRHDQQVKLRGYRIELGEIEALLNSHRAVRESAVLVSGGADEESRLVGYVVCKGEEVSGEELRNYVRGKAPKYMVPSAIVILKEMPLTANGKINRKALPRLDETRSEGKGRFIETITPIEEVLAEIWSKVLKVEQAGVYDNFFDLGGHSLLAIQLILRVREIFQVDLPLRSLFEAPTIAALAQSIDAALRESEGITLTRIERIPRDKELPLSFAIDARLRDEQLARERSELLRPQNSHQVFRLSGALHVRSMEQSLDEVIRRHEILRSSFPRIDGQPKQIIAPSLSLPMPVVNLDHLSVIAQEREAHQIIIELANKRFDLARAPLFSATLLRLSEREHMIVLIFERFIFDEWSEDVLFKEVAILYDSFSRSASPALPELPIQYADYAHWERTWVQGQTRKTLISYWERQLDGHDPFPKFELPMAKPPIGNPSYRGESQRLRLPPELTSAMRNLSRQNDVTLFTLLLAALKALLHSYTGMQNVGVISPIANRNQSETQDLIGWFSNRLVLRTDLSGDPSFTELLERARSVVLGAFSHQELPFSELMEELRPHYQRAEEALSPHIFFNLVSELKKSSLTNWMEEVRFPGMVVMEKIAVDVGTAGPELAINAREEAKVIDITIQYETERYDAPDITTLLDHFKGFLESIVSDPSQRLSQLSMPCIPQDCLASAGRMGVGSD